MGPRRFSGWRGPALAITLAVLAFVLGLWGFVQYDGLPADGRWTQWFDRAYNALQLYGVQFSPDPAKGDPPVALKWARFVAPAATLSLLLAALAEPIARNAAAWWLRSIRRGHVIVVGDNRHARMIEHAWRLRDVRVYRIDHGDEETLKQHGVPRARAVFACDERSNGTSGSRDNQNLATALTARRLRPEGVGGVHVHVGDLSLLLMLRASAINPNSDDIGYFNLDEIDAQSHMESERLNSGQPHILVAGATPFAEALLIDFARKWRTTSSSRVRVTLVDQDATAHGRLWQQRWPVLDRVCEMDPHDESFEAHVRNWPMSTPARPGRTYICYDDELAAMAAAVTADTLWGTSADGVNVRLSQLAAPAWVGAGLRVVSTNTVATERIIGMEFGIVRDLAKAVHGSYLATQADRGEVLGSRPSLVGWDDLPEDFRRANIAQARAALDMLRHVGAAIAPGSPQAPRFALSSEELELLAPIEHNRWRSERMSAGWRYGPVRDDARKSHPDLLPWEQLSERTRDKDRDAVRVLKTSFADALADLGLQIIRVAQPPIPLIAHSGVHSTRAVLE